MEAFRGMPMRFVLFLLIIFLSSCTPREVMPNYLTQGKPSMDIAVFARVGATQDEVKSAANHIRIHSSLKTINVDDLGVYIRPCERVDVLFCLSGGLPIILPVSTGVYQYKTDTRNIEVELIAPALDGTKIITSGRAACDVSMLKLIVKQGNEEFIYIISKMNGVVSITKATDRETQSWYLIAGRLIDLPTLCKKT